MKKFLFSLIMPLVAFTCQEYGQASTQIRLDEKEVCLIDGKSLTTSVLNVREGSSRMIGICNQIADFAGLPIDCIVYSSSSIPSAMAAVDPETGDRYIIYSSTYFDRITDLTNTGEWSLVFTLAHELGHHIAGHTLSPYNMRHQYEELVADYFAGYVLGRLCASRNQLADAMAFLSERGDEHHPPRSQRSQMALKGYDKGSPLCGKQGGGQRQQRKGELCVFNETNMSMQVFIVIGNKQKGYGLPQTNLQFLVSPRSSGCFPLQPGYYQVDIRETPDGDFFSTQSYVNRSIEIISEQTENITIRQ